MRFRNVPRPVFFLGLVSFFNDAASEMIYPIVPIFLTSVLHVPVSIIGLIEGIAEGTASIMKFIFGYISDLLQRRKFFVTSGYSLAAISKLLIGLATSWHLVLFARFIDRVGKGVRTSARDALLLQNATRGNKGFIFGFHRAFDSLGAVVGPLLALIFLIHFKDSIRTTFFIAFIPSVVAVLLLVIFIHEKHEKQKAHHIQKISLSFRDKNPAFLYFFIVSIIFALGNSADSFLILRAHNLGFSTTLAVLAYASYNLSQTIFATPAGSLADKIGARRVYTVGLLIFALVYLVFGLLHSAFLLWFIFPLYGLYIAATDGVSKAYISEFIEEKESGSYFGLYQTGISLATFFASFIAGLLWSSFSPSMPFYYGSLMAGAAFVLLMIGHFIWKK